MDSPPTTPITAHERIDAIERLLRELLLCLEGEGAEHFTMDAFGQWLQTSRRIEREHGTADPRQQVALGELALRVLHFDPPAKTR